MRLIVLAFLFLVSALQAQQSTLIDKQFNWSDNPILHNPTGQQERQIWTFEDALFGSTTPTLPIYMERFGVSGKGRLEVSVIKVEYQTLNGVKEKELSTLTDQLEIHTTVEQDRNQYFGKVFFVPIVKKGNQFEKVIDIQLQVRFIPTTNFNAQSRGGEYAKNSVLRNGKIYKIAVEETGIHRLTYEFLKDELKIDIDQIDPKTIRLFGNGGGILPEPIQLNRQDDLQENAILVVGEEDGRFDPADYILFYGTSPHKWEYQKENARFDRVTNIYNDKNHYFLMIDGTEGLRVKDQNNIPNTVYTSTSFDDYIRFEEEIVNLLDAFSSAQGTGKNWYGDLFETIRERSYNDFVFPNILTEELAHIQVSFAGRSRSETSVEVQVANSTFSDNIRRSNTGDIEDRYAHLGEIDATFQPTGDNLSVLINYPPLASSTGWLDFIQINARRVLQYDGSQLSFRDQRTLEFPNSLFQLAGASNTTQIWEVSDSQIPKNQEFENRAGGISFGAATNTLKEFIAFDPNGNFFSPVFVGEISNQNLHAIDRADLIIIVPEEFLEEAVQLAQHREAHNDYVVRTVLLDQVFNEFSSGNIDPTAIRDFTKMVFDRDPNFNYLLLFGDGSFDFRNIKNLPNPSGFIPVYETDESLHPIEGFPSDDYFALLSDNEGINLKGALDIAVGRLTVKSREEAQIVVNKLINYDKNPATLGEWKLRQVFVADDEDSGLHQRQADQIASKVDVTYDMFNVNKIYLDAFQQVTTPGGQRYPAAKEAFNNDIFKGVLVVNYLGHGGSRGWTQERVLEINDIISWTNANKLPLFVTATCSFTGYDDPNFVTAGEEVLLNPVGGGIGLFTTVRSVYSSSNERLTKAVFDKLFEPVNGKHPPIGELMRLAKNSNSSDTISINARKFTLIGDPSMQLALPVYNVVTDKIDDKTIVTNQKDTIKALQKVTIEGYISDNTGAIVSSFNGKIIPTIFDKKTRVANLGQDASSRVLPFDIQKNVLFKGTATVQNGRFTFTFVVPKDINYQFGPGKISYYAEDGKQDAAGFYNNIIIGGTNENAVNDTDGPLVNVFMNDTTFVFGGVTTPDPTLLVLLSDENGINVAGTSIGHDLTGVLDNNTQNTFQLNEFYESKLDDYTEGTVRYPLKDIPIGTHQIKVKAWDVFNNSSEGFTEFLVDNSAKGALERILNYPNPFTTRTEFQFVHNQGVGQLLEVQIRIFTVSGRLVKTITTQAISEGSRVSGIEWDGKDDFGEDLARGVYLYRISIKPNSSDTQITDSDFEKLVILK